MTFDPDRRYADELRARRAANRNPSPLQKMIYAALDRAAVLDETQQPSSKPKRTRKRTPTLAGIAKQATKAGIPVAGYEVRPDGSIGVVTSKPGETKPDANEWDGIVLQ